MVKEAKTESKVEMTTADKIWEEIKGVEVNMFGLPGQTVENNCTPISVEPERLYLKVRATAFIRILEDTIGKNYDVVLGDAYLMVSRKKV